MEVNVQYYVVIVIRIFFLYFHSAFCQKSFDEKKNEIPEVFFVLTTSCFMFYTLRLQHGNTLLYSDAVVAKCLYANTVI